MIVRIKRMCLENFKGIRQRVIDFESDVHNIEGKKIQVTEKKPFEQSF